MKTALLMHDVETINTSRHNVKKGLKHSTKYFIRCSISTTTDGHTQ